jgi:hypothetical protein
MKTNAISGCLAAGLLAVKLYQGHGVTAKFNGNLRSRDDHGEFFAYLVVSGVSYRTGKYLDLGMNYAKLTGTQPNVRGHHRWEIEAIPRWAVSERLTLTLRSRLEVRWLERQTGVHLQTRYRPMVKYQIKGMGPLQSIFASDELFIDHSRNQVVQNRLIPFGMDFRLGPDTGLAAYYMYFSARRNAQWDGIHFIGSTIKHSF